MSEMTMDKIGKVEVQAPIEVEGNLEDVANSGGGEAMEAAGGQAEEKKDKIPVVTDHMDDKWSEKYTEKFANADGSTYDKEVTYNYRHEDATVSRHMNRINPARGETESISPTVDGKSQNTTLIGNGPYKRDKYKSNPGVYKAKDVSDTPALTDLVTKTPSGTLIKKLQGTLENPNQENVLEHSLFINGTTSQDDIHQAYVGDCYFLAALLQVIHYDPAKIVNMMSLDGNTVSTRFYYKNGDKWSPTIIKTRFGFITESGSSPRGSFARLSYDPKTSEWSSSIDVAAAKLKINRKNYYEAALWVNAMEQAFSLYAQTYGKYGMGKDAVAQERYKLINGGYSGHCLHVFYGDQASDGDFEFSSGISEDSEDKSAVSINQNIIEELLLLAKNQDGPQKGDDVKEEENVDVHIMTCTFGKTVGTRLETYSKIVSKELDVEIENLQKQIDAANALEKLGLSAKLKNLQEAKENLASIATYAVDYVNAEDGILRAEGNTNLTQDKIRDKVDALSLKLEKNKDFMNLNLTSYTPMRAVLGTVVEQKNNNVFILAKHAYNVDHVNLVDAKGNDLKNEPIDVVMEKLDASKSTVYIQNPHGCTRKNYHEKVERSQEGGYEVDLESFLAVTEYITVATVKREQENQ